MPGILEQVLSRTRHATAGGGILSGLTSGGGILSTAMGPLQSRLASIQAAGTPQAKIQSLVGSLGVRLKSGGILSAGGSGGLLSKLGVGSGGLGSGLTSPGASSASTDTGFQVSSSGRVYGSPSPPPGISYR